MIRQKAFDSRLSRRAVSMKIAVKETKRGNIAELRKGLKTVSQRRGVDRRKGVDSTLFRKVV